MLSRRGFTLVELLVVIAVIGVLAGITFGLAFVLLTDSKEDQTRMVVDAVVVEIMGHGTNPIVIADGSSRMLWDIDVDLGDMNSESNLSAAVRQRDTFIIDGDPGLPGAPSTLTSVAPPGYKGFAKTVGFRAAHVDALGQVVDAWKKPLRIIWSAERFGASKVGVWSMGPDGISDPFNPASDDIRSWAQGGEP